MGPETPAVGVLEGTGGVPHHGYGVLGAERIWGRVWGWARRRECGSESGAGGGQQTGGGGGARCCDGIAEGRRTREGTAGPGPPLTPSPPCPRSAPVPLEPRLAAPAPVPSWWPLGRLPARLKPSSVPSLRAARQRGPDCSECRVSHVFFSFWMPPRPHAALSPSDPAVSKGPTAPHPPTGHGRAAGSGPPPPIGRSSPDAGGGRWALRGRAPTQGTPQLHTASGCGAALGGGVKAWGGGIALPSLHGGPGGAPSPSPFLPSSSGGGAESWGCEVGSLWG